MCVSVLYRYIETLNVCVLACEVYVRVGRSGWVLVFLRENCFQRCCYKPV